MDIRPRSGITVNTKLRVGNTPGTIDSDFRGEVNVIIDNIGVKDVFIAGSSNGHLVLIASTGITYDVTGANSGVKGNLDGTYLIRKGDRIAQALIQRIPHVEFTQVDALSESERGEGGFGHSGVTSEVTAE
ncbi:dUTPase [Paenibacillus sp. DS2015]